VSKGRHLSANALTGVEAAETARSELGLSPTRPIDDLLKLAEMDMGVAVLLHPLGDKGVDGAYRLDRDQPFILDNSSKAPVRQRFTLAHEIGHHRLGHSGRIEQKISFADNDPEEVQANYFAAEFLASSPALERWLQKRSYPQLDLDTLVDLASTFGVSAEMMLIRLETIERLAEAERNQLKQQIEAGDHLRSRFRRPIEDSIELSHEGKPRVPAEIRRRVLRGVDLELVSPEVAAKALRVSRPVLKMMMKTSRVTMSDE
jgi:Zn-dependent peptidase ImmA (M78 family)